MFTLSGKSRQHLAGVHPDLVKVVELAITYSTVDFGVTEGLRTLDDQKKYFAVGKSKTMDSMHLEQYDGKAHAVDLFAFVKGAVSYDQVYMRRVMQAMVTAAIELGVKITIGGLWRNFVDSPHYELDQKYYNEEVAKKSE